MSALNLFTRPLTPTWSPLSRGWLRTHELVRAKEGDGASRQEILLCRDRWMHPDDEGGLPAEVPPGGREGGWCWWSGPFPPSHVSAWFETLEVVGSMSSL